MVEHIFIDGGSTDGTVEYLRDNAHLVIEAPTSTIYSAQNIGIIAAKKEWVYFLGSDDQIVPGAISALIRELPTIVSEVVQVKISLNIDPSIFMFNPRQQSFIYRRRLYEKYGVYDEHCGLSADVKYNTLLAISGIIPTKRDINMCIFDLTNATNRTLQAKIK